MTGLLIMIALVVLLIVALAPAHHHSVLPFTPGADTDHDIDRARLSAELRIAGQR